jgi:hypothetical protein
MIILVVISWLNDLKIAPFVLFFSIVLLLINSKIKIKFSDILVLVALNLFSLTPLLNGEDFFKLMLSIAKINLIWILLSVQILGIKNNKINVILYRLFSFNLSPLNIFFILALSILMYLIYPENVDNGIFNIPRFNGIGYDPNLTASALLFFIIYFDSLKIYSYLILLFTQSLTNITALVIYKFRFSKYLLLLLIIITILFIVLYQKIELVENVNFLDERINSFLMRTNSWGGVFDYLSQNLSVLFFGVGSGKSYEISGIVFHNFFIQTVYDKGILFSILFFLFLTIKFYKLLGYQKSSTLLIPMCLLDPIWTLIFPTSYFICKNSKGISKKL